MDGGSLSSQAEQLYEDRLSQLGGARCGSVGGLPVTPAPGALSRTAVPNCGVDRVVLLLAAVAAAGPKSMGPHGARGRRAKMKS
jgi:hypothetical protein|eukprot:COSAG02_NODE_468_length_21758_cov_41.206796_19_plen_84_part_00